MELFGPLIATLYSEGPLLVDGGTGAPEVRTRYTLGFILS